MGSKTGAEKVAAKRIGVPLEEYQARIAAGEKWCHNEKHWVVRSGFAVDRSRGDGLAAVCRACRASPDPYASLRGRVSTFLGRTHSEAARSAMSLAKKGRPSGRLGKHHTPETRQRISAISRERTPRGETHYAYTHGESQRNREIRRSAEYGQWRTAVFERDCYTCQHCGDKQGGNLQAHHLKPYAEFPELRLEISNGLTLCQDCHERVHLKPIPKAKARRKKHPLPEDISSHRPTSFPISAR